MKSPLEHLGKCLARYLDKPHHIHSSFTAIPISKIQETLQPADVLLVEGNTRLSSAIKYLTQSTWSHAALYVGPQTEKDWPAGHSLIEANTVEGVRSADLKQFTGLHTRICRPDGLSADERQQVVSYAIDRLGLQYDLRNIFDLARYLLPEPPVPARFRRRLISLGSGDPSRAICSTLIAQAFQSINYPILPMVEHRPSGQADCAGCTLEVYHIRNYSLFAPRDFDVSPYFSVVKPKLADGFDFHKLRWGQAQQLRKNYW